MKELRTVSVTTVTTIEEVKDPDFEIITPPQMRSFTCYNCRAVFKASHKKYYKTQTQWGCVCPCCGERCYSKS